MSFNTTKCDVDFVGVCDCAWDADLERAEFGKAISHSIRSRSYCLRRKLFRPLMFIASDLFVIAELTATIVDQWLRVGEYRSRVSFAHRGVKPTANF